MIGLICPRSRADPCLYKKITNKEYRQLNPSVTDRTVLNDFNELIEKNVIMAKGEKKYRYYTLR